MPVWSDWRSTVRFGDDGPGVTVLYESSELKVVLVGLRAGQSLPEHPGPAASFHFLDGAAVMSVDSERIEVTAGATVVVPPGGGRGVRAVTDVVFLGSVADPASEDTPAR